MTKRFGSLLAGVALALTAIATPARCDDARLWQEGDVLMFQQAARKGGIGWKLASEPSSARLHAWELKPKLQWNWRPGLDSALTYKFVRGRGGERWAIAQALEWDLTSSWTTGQSLKTRLTQRLGIARPATGALDYRYHAIPRIDWPGHWLPGQLSADTSLEGVYDLRNTRWHESKLSPMRLKFHSSRGADWFIAYVFNYRRASPSTWSREHIVQLAVAFNIAGLRQ